MTALSTIAASVLHYLLIGGLVLLALVVLCLALVAFADAGVRPIKLNYLVDDPGQIGPETRAGELALSVNEAQESGPVPPANDEAEPAEIAARRKLGSR